ncbi:MAG: hypothetical protein C5B49_10660 [Bdellovibrio sp.]|nr:MAG: hypothetical protein C5B49_10660 [Bdellovibrio sp.]
MNLVINWNLKSLRSRFSQIYAHQRDRIFFVFLLGASVLALLTPWNSFQSSPPTAEAFEPDTMIPLGFVLVPIELENQQSLESMIGSHAVVNLYKGYQIGGQKGVLIGRHLRLLRAPLNPQQFAVLVPESEVPSFVAPGAKFYAVVQNRSSQDTTEVMQSKKKSVEYFQGESP